VTIRQYRSGRVEIPRGAKRIDYGERYGFLPECDYVFSATASPNITIKRERLEESGTKKNQIFVDLAVPRDIEISVGELENITLYDIDSFHMEVVSEETKELLGQAEGLLREKIQEYVSWYEAKDAVPMLLEISRQAAEDVVWRLGGPLAQAESAQRERLEQSIEASVQKVVNKLMFGIRDSLDAETFRDCLTAIQKLYENKEAP
jgi:glutamyl-tRNA reductase